MHGTVKNNLYAQTDIEWQRTGVWMDASEIPIAPYNSPFTHALMDNAQIWSCGICTMQTQPYHALFTGPQIHTTLAVHRYM